MDQRRNEKPFLTTSELAKTMNISRIAVFKKIRKGYITATKVGRAYVIDKKEIPGILGHSISDKNKQEIRQSVSKTIKEYGSTLRMLGNE